MEIAARLQLLGLQRGRHDSVTSTPHHIYFAYGNVYISALLSQFVLRFFPLLCLHVCFVFLHLRCYFAKSLQLCLTWCDPMEYSLPGYTVHIILQTRILSGLPCPPPWIVSDPWIKPTSLTSPVLADRLFTTSATWASPLLPGKQVHQHQLSRFHVYVLIHNICFSLSDFTLYNRLQLHPPYSN